MNRLSSNPSRRQIGFTLIELLVVISIIGVLAGIAMPALSSAKKKAQVAKAKMEINDLAAAIGSYINTYSRMPAAKETRQALDNPDLTPDFTYGTVFRGQVMAGKKKPRLPDIRTQNLNPRLQKNNSEVIAIVKDLEQFRNPNYQSPNIGHSLNPQRIAFLNAKETDSLASPGIGPDGVYRDPWGSPYIITLDMNGDDRCRDGFYSMDKVSATAPGSKNGYDGLSKSAGNNTFEYRGSVMVWSLGPDASADFNQPANKGANRDNIVSWK